MWKTTEITTHEEKGKKNNWNNYTLWSLSYVCGRASFEFVIYGMFGRRQLFVWFSTWLISMSNLFERVASPVNDNGMVKSLNRVIFYWNFYQRRIQFSEFSQTWKKEKSSHALNNEHIDRSRSTSVYIARLSNKLQRVEYLHFAKVRLLENWFFAVLLFYCFAGEK